MAVPLVQRVRDGIRTQAYRLTDHAEGERDADAISVREIEEAFGSGELELIEQYADDPRGASALFLGFTVEGKPLHAVLGLSSPDVVVFITVYRPREELWYDWRRRV